MKSVVASCVVLSVTSSSLRAETTHVEAIEVLQPATTTLAYNHSQAKDIDFVNRFEEEAIVRRGSMNPFRSGGCFAQ